MWLDKAQIWQLAHTFSGPALVDLIVEHSHSCYLGRHRPMPGIVLEDLSAAGAVPPEEPDKDIPCDFLSGLVVRGLEQSVWLVGVERPCCAPLC